MSRAATPPLLVTGLPRSGTSWVGKMLEASGELVYINEPLNPGHPPGRSPGVLDAEVTHRFQYISEQNEGDWLAAFQKAADLRYGLRAELRRNRGPYDLARCAKYLTAFTAGRARGRRALFDDPFAVLSTAWFAGRLGCTCLVLVRDPVSVVGSWRRLGWAVHFHELLEQQQLVADHLHGDVDRIRAMIGSMDWLARSSLLWELTYALVDSVFRDLPGVHVARYEDLATEPMRMFPELYRQMGLSWTASSIDAVHRATTAEGGPGEGSHTWSLRGAPSRTAFRPLDSQSAVESASRRLDPAEAARVRDLTAAVAGRFGYQT